MKKLLALVLAVVALLCCLVGCNNSKEIVLTDEDIHTDYAGVYLTLSSVDTSGEHKKLNAVWHNETTKTVTYGNWFVIEKKDGDNWTDVSTTDVSFTEEDEREKLHNEICRHIQRRNLPCPYRILCSRE